MVSRRIEDAIVEGRLLWVASRNKFFGRWWQNLGHLQHLSGWSQWVP